MFFVRVVVSVQCPNASMSNHIPRDVGLKLEVLSRPAENIENSFKLYRTKTLHLHDREPVCRSRLDRIEGTKTHILTVKLISC